MDRLEQALTSTRWVWTYLSSEGCPSTLIELLSLKLPSTPFPEWERRLALGGCYINGERVLSDITLTPPFRIEYFEPRFDIDNPHATFPPFQPDWVVYKDESIAAVFKPHRLSSLPPRERMNLCLKSYVDTFFGVKTHFPSRLDSATAGLMVMSLDPDVHPRLQRLFETRQVQKTYRLRSSGVPEWRSVSCVGPIGKDRRHPILRQVTAPGEGKPAVTEFSVIRSDRLEGSSLIDARPLTGRTHQIRVHISSLGFPIIGDNFYNGPPHENLQLLSFKVAFPHPVTRRPIEIELPERLVPGWARAVP